MLKRKGVAGYTVILLIVALAISACSKGVENNSDGGGDVTQDTTIKIRVMNDYGNIDPIIEAYEERVKDDPIMSNIHLEFEYVGGGDYKDKLSMAVTAQEDYDLMFAGSWHGLDGYIASGAFKDISEYFNNDAYPGLKAAFSQDFIEPCYTYSKGDDGEWNKELYKIPLAQSLYDIRGLAYREDLRVKYGIPEITNDSVMMDYLKAIHENEPEMIPLQMYNGFFYWESKFFQAAQDNIYGVDIVGEESTIWVAVNDEGTEVLNAVVMGDSEDAFMNMPDGYQYDFIKESQVERLKWADYMDPVRGTTETAVGTPAVVYSTLTGFLGEQKNLAEDEGILSEYPDASLRFYPTEESQRNMEPGAIVTDMKSNNFLVVPEWSDKTDAVMHFLDWMYGSAENHDLFQYGIEGINWESTGDTTYNTLEVTEDLKYTMPGYSFTWNPTYVRYEDAVANNSELKGWYDYMLDASAYTPSLISGFTFDATPVETEVANVSALSSELLLRFALHGDETEQVIDQYNQDAKEVGLDTVREELVQQVQDFLDMKHAAN